MLSFIFSKNYRILLVIFALTLIWHSFVLRIIFPIHFPPQSLFWGDLIGHPFYLPLWFGYFSLAINIFLLYLISQKIFSKKKSCLAPFIFGILPWPAYLLSAGSIYPVLLSLMLLTGYGFLQLSSKIYSRILIIAGAVLLLYSWSMSWIILPLALGGGLFLKAISLKNLQSLPGKILILSLPVIVAAVFNFAAVQNIFSKEIAIFSDPGILWSNDNFMGEDQKKGFFFFSKLAENKYQYLIKYLTLKTLKNFTPGVYFTPQEKLLGFSFSPPIYLGFLIPFFYGLYRLLMQSKIKKYLVLSLVLIIPATLSKPVVDLNKLFIVLPVIIFIISYGLILLYQMRRKKQITLILLLTVLLILIQMSLTIFDLTTREQIRFAKTICESCFKITQP